jgi:hypothetical protein
MVTTMNEWTGSLVTIALLGAAVMMGFATSL